MFLTNYNSNRGVLVICFVWHHFPQTNRKEESKYNSLLSRSSNFAPRYEVCTPLERDHSVSFSFFKKVKHYLLNV
jgi:hypothetical protein